METILRTKLFKPKTSTDLVKRARLLEQLDGGLNRKLVLVCAPAGYGKTTLINDWLDQLETYNEKQICWISLDEDDNDPQQFFSYLAAATEGLPGVEVSLSRTLQINQAFSNKILMKAFLQDVTPVTGPFILVLDDYHSIDSSDLDDAMAFLTDHMPPQLTLVLLSRSDPGFPISRLRARGELLELRAEALRFTEAEAADFISHTMQLTMPSDQVSALKNRTEGWIAGLKMAALSLQNRSGEEVAHFVENFAGTHRFIMDYLSDEVLNQVSASEQTFLLSTAVLPKFCAGLCDAVLPEEMQGQAQAFLTKLESGNSFVIPLDDERRWFRYHHLFADLLRQKLSAEDRNAARRKACEWSRENDFITDAIEYALAAEAWDLAIPLLVDYGLSFVFKGKLTTLRHWFDTLPREIFMSEPRMCLDYAWALVNQGQFQDVEQYLIAAEETSQCAPHIRTVSALIRANIARIWEDVPVMRNEAELALTLAPEENAVARCTAFLQLGAAELLDGTGDKEKVLQYLEQAQKLAEKSRNMNSLILSGGYLGLVSLQRNDVQATRDAVQTTLKIALDAQLEKSPLLTYTYLVEAHLAVQNEQWSLAREALEKARDHGHHAGEMSSLFRSNLLLAVVEAHHENFDGVKQAMLGMQEIAAVLRNPEPAKIIEFAQATLLMGGLKAQAVETLRLCAAGVPLPGDEHKVGSALSAAQSGLVDPLSEREMEILAFIADGLKNKEIAEKMFISLNTVLFHTKNIYQKLGVNKRTQAMIKAQELHLFDK